MDLIRNKEDWLVRKTAPRPVRPALERFFEKIEVSKVHYWDSTPCWDWTGHINETTGYGQLKDDHQRVVNAHAFSYDQFVGDIEPGQELTQGCDRRQCCNPRHIYPIKRRENKKRRKPHNDDAALYAMPNY